MTIETMWMYFRIFVGVVLVAAFVFLLVTKSFDTDLIAQLLMVLIGILEAGTGVLAFRSRKIVKK